ncbi:actin-binding LIM protein 1 [Cricetulus griseus]
MVKEKVAHPQDPHHSSEKPAIHCHKCGEPCKGEVLRVQTKHFHIKCFTCKDAHFHLEIESRSMGETAFVSFVHGQCPPALKKPPAQALKDNFQLPLCSICKQTYRLEGNCLLCHLTIDAMVNSYLDCAGCGRDIKNGQALLALDKQWHLGCFKCKSCGKVLTGEYISKDGSPYCEKDYQGLFGVKCEACHQFITGKVLEAGDKHYHPSCARCSRCNQMFTEGEEMYLQGSTVWHPDCKQSTKTEEKLRAKVDNEILDYKDLAAIPKVKAIYDIERPDLITYEPFYTSGYEDKQERQSLGEGSQDVRDRMIHRSTSQGSINSPVYSRHSYTPTTSRSPQHFHRPEWHVASDIGKVSFESILNSQGIASVALKATVRVEQEEALPF